jgi:soluble lytic murein transglycosylase-like protein
MRARCLAVLLAAIAALAAPGPAQAAGYTNVQIAGLQVALRAHGLYRGPIDGVAGPQTARAVRVFQRRAGLAVDGIAGLRTRMALGKLGRPLFGRRVLRRGAVGWDVSVLQFLLRKRGDLTCAIDGRFGSMTAVAVRRFQRRAGLRPDGVAGRSTLAALAPPGARAAPERRSAPSTRYVVRPGDSLTSIARRHRTTVAALARLNGLDPRRVLVIGTRLRVPAVRDRRSSGESPAWVRTRIDYWSARYGVDRRLVRALAWMESGYQTNLVSRTGDFGVMQVSEGTWAFVQEVLLGRKLPRTTDANIRAGVVFLHHLLHRFRGNVRLALAGYHQGPESVRRAGLLPWTKRYVANILALRTRV